MMRVLEMEQADVGVRVREQSAAAVPVAEFRKVRRRHLAFERPADPGNELIGAFGGKRTG